nr:hypothetical protein [Tanacetum cinerariifolium]
MLLSIATVVTAAATTAVSFDELIMAQALVEIKTSRPKAKGIFMQEPKKRNRPPTKAQQRSIISTYLKNMDGWKPRALKNNSFAEIKELFDKAIERINNFVNFITELVEKSTKKDMAEIAQENSSKRAGDELNQERSKKQKIEDKNESA